MKSRYLTAWLAVLLAVWAIVPAAVGNEDSPRRSAVMALEEMAAGSGRGPVEEFIDDRVDPGFEENMTREGLVRLLMDIRTVWASAGAVSVRPEGESEAVIELEPEDGRVAVIYLRLESGPPYRIVDISLGEGEEVKSPEPERVGWDGLAEFLRRQEEKGFSGAVLVVRGGEVFLNEGYGLADRDGKIPVTTETVFGIGSTPIDFTRAAVLRLEDMGLLSTSDPVADHIPGVPEDKRAMTIDHLMGGRSGLPNFHHRPGVDADFDLSWIDREEALERILSRELLFQPGNGDAHSHSAFTVLAAVVEHVSGRGYGEFLREEFFEPLGMDGTGLYQHASSLPPGIVAVGYGRSRAGRVNSPRHWGETSWLVMGSGGMVSRPIDLYRWVRGIREGKVLSKRAREKYWLEGVLAGGSDRGFLCVYTQGPGEMFFLCSNSHESVRDIAEQTGRALARLVESGD